MPGSPTARRALQLSLNVPAVELLNGVGPARFVARLRQAGAQISLPAEAAPGLAVGLGGLGITLADLTRLYVGFARGGDVPALVRRPVGSGSSPSEARIVDPVAAWYVSDILRGAPPPENAPSGRIAFKTGTSYGYRDAWAIGFDGRHVIGIWAGRPDGAPVPGLVGVDAAAPEIAYPPKNVRVDLGLRGGDPMPLALKVRSGAPPYTWFVDGAPIGTTQYGTALSWDPRGPGFVTLMVIDAAGASSTASVFLE